MECAILAIALLLTPLFAFFGFITGERDDDFIITAISPEGLPCPCAFIPGEAGIDDAAMLAFAMPIAPSSYDATLLCLFKMPPVSTRITP